MLPPPFVKQMQALLGNTYPAFEAAMLATAPVSVRTNPHKIPNTPDALFPDATPVPWCPGAWYLPERPVFTLDPRFQAAAYYVQEASSMFLHEALRQTVEVTQPLRVLDLCAAPGGKSTLLASLLHPHSLLVANEVIRQRTTVLRENLEKWGIPNSAVTSAGANDFAAMEGWFDVVVTDAPCSGEGLFRKDPNAVNEWSLAQVDVCAARQKTILAGAVAALKPGGVLAYSTCTFNRLENENNTAWLASEYNLEPLRLSPPDIWGIVETDGGYRFFPHRVRGEGFFIALFRKPEAPNRSIKPPAHFRNVQHLAKNLVPEARAWLRDDADMRFYQTPNADVLALPAHLNEDYRVLDVFLKNKWFGTRIGQFKGQDFVPDHALALSNIVSPTLPAAELTREQALLFLKKENFELPAGSPAKGWVLARYQGLNLGWMKVLPTRWNNYLPQERRIRMEVR
ncbi:MAG: RNA methyltransferase [Lewinellaceae bacterium]|nr:RNA methyltransferase [Lewinellaceae bacterium]